MHQTNRPHLRALAERATPGPWELQTSNSWRRIGTAGARFADGDVLAPTTHRGDNHPDLAARQEDLDFIVAADPATVLALLDEIDRLKTENAELRRDAERYRWLRNKSEFGTRHDPAVYKDGPTDDLDFFHGDELDAAIDQAMTKEQP